MSEITKEEMYEKIAEAVDQEGLGYGIQNGYVWHDDIWELDEELANRITEAQEALDYIDLILGPYYP